MLKSLRPRYDFDSWHKIYAFFTDLIEVLIPLQPTIISCSRDVE